MFKKLKSILLNILDCFIEEEPVMMKNSLCQCFCFSGSNVCVQPDNEVSKVQP